MCILPAKVVFILVLIFFPNRIFAQDWQLVWADEFADPAIDQNTWGFETGPTYETLHYYTDRVENAQIVDGMLNIFAHEESYQGYNYTSALLKTQNKFYWRYGRIEARMKLPQTTGFVPAFWMLAEDELYGYWPTCGEIDIMEHPTNQDRIFGTCHCWQYSYYTGSMTPAGSSIKISDSETAFHIYAVEWTPEKIDFYVDEEKYYTYSNDHSGFRGWPFDQPFYLLLAIGVGGGWAGNPDASTVFPGVMQVDYVRVYQNTSDLVIAGEDYVVANSKNIHYTIPGPAGASYSWTVPNGAQITAGQNTRQISVDWGLFGGDVTVEVTTGDGTVTINSTVTVSDNLVKNPGFEKGVKYWQYVTPQPNENSFSLTTDNPHSGNSCYLAEIKTPGVNPWDVQIAQRSIYVNSGKNYSAGLWARKDGVPANVNIAIINTANNYLYVSKTISVTDTWQQFDMNFTAPANVPVSFNVDAGGNTGKFYLDDFSLIGPQTSNTNQVINADFSAGLDSWNTNTFLPADASFAVENGELKVTIRNGGVNTWDVHVGQAGVSIENGKGYTLSFDAYASTSRDIFAFVGKNADPWTVYSGNDLVRLSNKKQTYTLTFTMQDATDIAARFGFDIGGAISDVYIDNVFLSTGKTPSKIKEPADNTVQAFRLLQNMPNPFNPVTTIQYELSIPAFVTLAIYNINGELVETLVNSSSPAGSYSVYWYGSHYGSGIYFCKLAANGFYQINKMMLVK